MADLTMRSERMKAHARIRDLELELRDTRATLRQSLQHRDTLRADLAEARAQIAAKDAEIAQLRQAITKYQEFEKTRWRPAQGTK